MNLILYNNLFSCSHSIILSNSKLIFFVSSATLCNSFLFSMQINVVSSAYVSILKYFLDVCFITFM